MSARKRNAIFGFSADIGGMVLIQLLSLALIPFYLRYLSLADYGYWLVILSVIGWMGLADFGIGFAVTRFFVKAMSGQEDEKTHVNRVANTSLFLFLLIAVIFIAAGSILLPFLQKWFHIGSTVLHDFSIAFMVAMISSTIMIPFALFSGLLEAKQKIALNRNIQTAGVVVQFLSSIVFVMIYKNIIGLAVSVMAGNIVSALLLAYYVTKEKILRFSIKHVSRSLLGELFSFGGYFQLGKTANIIATNTDSLFIASFLDAAKVPVYNFTSRLPLVFCNTIPSKISAALFSGMSQVFDLGDKQLFKITFRKLLALMLRMAFFAGIIIFFVNEKFVNVWVGHNNFGGFYLNLVFVYWVFFETLIRGTGIVIQIYGDMKMWAFAAIVESALNIGLSFYFLYTGWNILGLALATAIARTVTIGIYWLWFLVNRQLISFRQFLRSLLQNVVQNLPVFGVLYVLSVFVHMDNTWLELILYPMIGVLINMICYDWQIVYTAIRKGSVRSIYDGYLKKY